MILAIVTEEVDELGGRRYVAKLAELVDEDEEKPYSMMGLGPSWNHRDLAILVMYRHDLKKAAEILGRSEDACRQKLYRLGLLMGVNLKKDSPQIMLVFPKEYIERRRARVKESQADGCVVGLTGFVKGEYIENIQRVVGDRVVFLMQGIGPQGGEATKIKYVTNPLVSLGRAVIYSDNPREAIKRYHDRFKSMKSIRL